MSNPNILVTQQDATRQHYRAIYRKLASKACEYHGVVDVQKIALELVAKYFLLREPGWAKSTARLYRAAIAFVFREMNTSSSDLALGILYRTAMDLSELEQLREQMRADRKQRARSSPQTSAQKAKSVATKDMILLRNALENSRGRHALATRNWFFATVLTGLRPCEWATAKLILNNAHQLTLVVRNAKNTNSRAHSDTRSIVLAALPESDIDLIKVHLENVKNAVAAKNFEGFYSTCRKFLRNIVTMLWAHRRKRPSLYTARHIFGAAAKNEFDCIAVAALMGHASIETAYRHYGMRHTVRGGTAVVPDQADKDAVVKSSAHHLAHSVSIQRIRRFGSDKSSPHC